MRLSYFPHIKVVHTSKRFHEQVYMPLANWLLMIGTVVVTAVYNNVRPFAHSPSPPAPGSLRSFSKIALVSVLCCSPSPWLTILGINRQSLGNAYGVCVIFVTFITTCMVSLVAILTWRLPVYLVLPVFLIFGALDGVYLTSVLTKVPSGAWFTILLSLILSSVFILWRFGKEAQWNAESLDRLRPASLLTLASTTSSASLPNPNAPTTLRLAPPYNPTPVSTVPGLGIFFDKAGDPDVLPPSFTHFVRKFAARPPCSSSSTMRPLPVPSVPLGERFIVTRCPGSGARSGLLPNCYNVVLRHGYVDDVLRPAWRATWSRRSSSPCPGAV